MQSWTLDTIGGSGSGTYKNMALSDQLYEAAFEKTELMNWVTPAGGYGKKKGESLDLPTITGPAEPSSAVLTENVRIPEDTVALTNNRLTVAEFGRAITHSNLFDELSKYDIKNRIQKRLREQMRLSLDFHSAQLGFRTFKHTYTATGPAAATVDTTGTPSVAQASNLNVFHMQAIRDLLYGSLKAPFFGDGDTYICVASWAACRGLRSDPLWKEWYTLGHPEKLERGEIGMIESIRTIETNHDTALKNASLGGGVTGGEAFIFGDEAVAFIEAQTPELRIKVGDDYGRTQGVAWYGILTWGLYHNTANAREARGVRFTGNQY